MLSKSGSWIEYRKIKDRIEVDNTEYEGLDRIRLCKIEKDRI